jgi:hypothetical protein
MESCERVELWGKLPDVRPGQKEQRKCPRCLPTRRGPRSRWKWSRRKSDGWRPSGAETAYVSSSSDLAAHPAFHEIVGMGPAVIPLLLRELECRTGHWHRALRRITGTDPVPLADRGNIDKPAEAWLRWGK